MNNQKLEEFWTIYDAYIILQNDEVSQIELRPKLSSLLAEIENTDRRTQVLHPTKGHNILAWQVLRDQTFYLNDRHYIDLHQGELLGWMQQWDRDVFLTRIPYRENVSGYILNPGSFRSDVGGDPYNDERGLYLPIFSDRVLGLIAKREAEKIRPFLFKFLMEEKGFDSHYLAMTL